MISRNINYIIDFRPEARKAFTSSPISHCLSFSFDTHFVLLILLIKFYWRWLILELSHIWPHHSKILQFILPVLVNQCLVFLVSLVIPLETMDFSYTQFGEANTNFLTLTMRSNRIYIVN